MMLLVAPNDLTKMVDEIVKKEIVDDYLPSYEMELLFRNELMKKSLIKYES